MLLLLRFIDFKNQDEMFYPLDLGRANICDASHFSGFVLINNVQKNRNRLPEILKDFMS